MKLKRPSPINTFDYGDAKIIERKDGFYCQDKQGKEELGPFATFLEAAANIDDISDAELEPGEDLKEAEEELGISDWIDPDTGTLAEESGPHIEDH